MNSQSNTTLTHINQRFLHPFWALHWQAPKPAPGTAFVWMRHMYMYCMLFTTEAIWWGNWNCALLAFNDNCPTSRLCNLFSALTRWRITLVVAQTTVHLHWHWNGHWYTGTDNCALTSKMPTDQGQCTCAMTYVQHHLQRNDTCATTSEQKQCQWHLHDNMCGIVFTHCTYHNMSACADNCALPCLHWHLS